MEAQATKPALLERFPQRHLLAGRLAGVAVAARLEPAVELAVVQQEDARAVGRHRDRAAGQVPREDSAVERMLVAQHEIEDAVAVARLLSVGGDETAERVGERGERGRWHAEQCNRGQDASAPPGRP